MNVQSMQVSQQAAMAALREYKSHRNVYDKRDWEIERIYRAISKGKTVISVANAIVRAGLDDLKRPRLAICEAHARECRATFKGDSVVFGIAPERGWGEGSGRITVPWAGVGWGPSGRLTAALPRIPPQHRPPSTTLSSYHILWEADWKELPRDPYLLKRIGKDAWVVLAAWDLTDVEMAVLRSHQVRR